MAVKGESIPKIEDYDLPGALKQNYLSVVNQIRIPYMVHFLSLDKLSKESIICSSNAIQEPFLNTVRSRRQLLLL